MFNWAASRSPGNPQSIPCRSKTRGDGQRGRWMPVQCQSVWPGEQWIGWEGGATTVHEILELKIPRVPSLLLPLALLLHVPRLPVPSLFSLHCHGALSSCVAPGYADFAHSGLQLGAPAKPARCWAGLDYGAETMVSGLISGLLKARLDLVHGETDREGILEESPLNFTCSLP